MGYDFLFLLIFNLLPHNRLISLSIHALLNGTYVSFMSQMIEIQQSMESITHNHNKDKV